MRRTRKRATYSGEFMPVTFVAKPQAVDLTNSRLRRSLRPEGAQLDSPGQAQRRPGKPPHHQPRKAQRAVTARSQSLRHQLPAPRNDGAVQLIS